MDQEKGIVALPYHKGKGQRRTQTGPAKEIILQHRGPEQVGTQKSAGVRTIKAKCSVPQNKGLLKIYPVAAIRVLEVVK